MRKYRSAYYKPRSLKRLERNYKRNIILSLLLASLLAFFLLTWGLPALIGGLSVFHRLNPGQKTNHVVEDSAIAPPVLNIPYESTNTAQIKINGFAKPSGKVEIYLDDELQTTTNVSEQGSFQTNNINLSLGTNNIYGKTLDNDKKSLLSKPIKLIYNNQKPKLEVSEPPDNLQIKGGDKKVRVSGKTDSNNNISINSTTVIVGGDGNFTTVLSLNEGDNTITVLATSSFNNTTQIERKVIYIP